MNRVFLLVFFTLSIMSFGQKTKTIRSNGESTYEIYEVLKKKKKRRNIEHGSYKKYSSDDSLLVEGYYTKGQKSGEWSFYSWKGVLKKKYDYDNQEITYYNPKADTVTNLIRVNGELKRVILDWPPHYKGGDDERMRIIQENIEYPMKAIDNGESGTVEVCFFLTPDGKAIDHYVKQSVSTSLDEEALRVVKLLVDWKPAKYKGKPIELLITVPITFRLG